MKIKKLGHCCLVIETKGIRIMTDPGNFSTLQNQQKNIDLVLITHEHADHVHVESLKQVIKNNPTIKIITNTSVGRLLDSESIPYTIIDDMKSLIFNTVSIEGHGQKHAEIYDNFGQVENTGYFVDNYLFYPGDSFCNPNKPVKLLALPVAGPWVKIKESIEYAVLLNPEKVFPVHDGMLQKNRIGGSHRVPQVMLQEKSIEFIPLLEGEEHEF